MADIPDGYTLIWEVPTYNKPAQTSAGVRQRRIDYKKSLYDLVELSGKHLGDTVYVSAEPTRTEPFVNSLGKCTGIRHDHNSTYFCVGNRPFLLKSIEVLAIEK